MRRGETLDLIATVSDLDPTRLLPLPFVADLGYVYDMTRTHFAANLSEVDGVSRLTLLPLVPVFEKSRTMAG